jgi:hypothetical protein
MNNAKLIFWQPLEFDHPAIKIVKQIQLLVSLPIDTHKQDIFFLIFAARS